MRDTSFPREISDRGLHDSQVWYPTVTPQARISKMPASEPEVGEDGSSKVELLASHLAHGFR